MTSSASSSQLPRILLGALIGAVLGLLMLGVALAAWWLAVARHEPQPIVAPEGFEARLEAARAWRERVGSEAYRASLVGTLGLQPELA